MTSSVVLRHFNWIFTSSETVLMWFTWPHSYFIIHVCQKITQRLSRNGCLNMWYLRPNYLHSGIYVPENIIIFFFFFFWLFVYVVLDFKVQNCYITVTFIKVHIIDLYIYLCVWTYELFDKIYSLVSMILFVNKYITQIKQLYIFDGTRSFLKYWH